MTTAAQTVPNPNRCWSTRPGLRRIPHEGRRRSSSAAGRRRTPVRSAMLCLAPVDDLETADDPEPDPRPAPPARASRDVTRLSRVRTSLERRIAARPTRLTIPISLGGVEPRGFVQQGLSARHARRCAPDHRGRADQTLFVDGHGNGQSDLSRSLTNRHLHFRLRPERARQTVPSR